MYLTYQPDGQEAQRWEIDLRKFRSMEIEAIEKVTGFDYGTTYKERLVRGNALARRALLWTMQRRIHPTTKFADVDFADGELQLELDREELDASRKAIAEADGLPEDERAMALHLLDLQIAQSAGAGEIEGKALTPSGETGTGSASPS